MNSSFYKDVRNNTYVNTFYALCIALDSYLSNKLLEGDSKRIVYTQTEYALRKRCGQNEWSNANLPFINYKMTQKSFGGDRNWFSMEAFSQGIYIDSLQKKLRITPISISFDCTYWAGRDDDYQYAIDSILLDASAETKIKYYMDYNGVLVENIAVVNFDFDTSPRFSDEEWLTQNTVWAISLNPTIQTWLPIGNIEGYCIPKTLLFDFAVKHDYVENSITVENIEYEDLYQFTIDHINGKITEKN